MRFGHGPVVQAVGSTSVLLLTAGSLAVISSTTSAVAAAVIVPIVVKGRVDAALSVEFADEHAFEKATAAIVVATR